MVSICFVNEKENGFEQPAPSQESGGLTADVEKTIGEIRRQLSDSLSSQHEETIPSVLEKVPRTAVVDIKKMPSKKPNNIDFIRANTTFPRLKFLTETKDYYRVQLGDKRYEIAKDDETAFMPGNATSVGMGLRLELRQIIRLETTIFQDREAPDDFKEVMIFHELREMEYKEADFSDAHDRAVHDEMLYVIKYFDKEKRQQYFEFAQQYRKAEKIKELLEERKARHEERKRRIHEERERQRLEKKIRRAECERKRQEQKKERQKIKFLENRPDLKEFIDNAIERYKRLRPEFRKNFHDDGVLKMTLNYWDKTRLQSSADSEKFIQEVQKYIKGKKAKPTFAHYLNGWRKRGDHHEDMNYDNKWGAQSDKEDLEKLLKKGEWKGHVYNDEDRVGKDVAYLMTIDEIEYLSDVLMLFDEVEESEKNGTLSRDFLHELSLKSDALRGVKTEPYFCHSDAEEEQLKAQRPITAESHNKRKEKFREEVKKIEERNNKILLNKKSFFQHCPGLDEFLRKAEERHMKMSCERKEDLRRGEDSFYNIVSSSYKFKLRALNESILSSDENTSDFMRRMYASVEQHPDKSVLAFICGWGEKGEDGSIRPDYCAYFNTLKGILIDGSYRYKGKKGDFKLKEDEKEHLGDFIHLYEEIEKKGKSRELTRAFLMEAYLKSRVLCEGVNGDSYKMHES